MSTKLTPVMTLFVVALGLWAGANSLADYFGHAHERTALSQRSGARGSGTRGDKQQITLSSELQTMEEQVSAHPDDIEARLTFGRALIETGRREQQSGYLMKAVEAFGGVLQKDPKHKEALLALGELCFESGLVDLAEGYYERFLKLDPANVKASTDYALVQLQLGKTNAAVSHLEKIVDRNPKLFPPRLALALAYSVDGSKTKAQTTARAALKIAPDENAKEHVEQFMQNLEKNPEVAAATSAPTNPQKLSPAMLVEEQLRSHPILGPKLGTIRWENAHQVKIELKNFPVEQMPPFARARLESRFKENLAALPEKTDLIFVDAESSKELLRINVGGN